MRILTVTADHRHCRPPHARSRNRSNFTAAAHLAPRDLGHRHPMFRVDVVGHGPSPAMIRTAWAITAGSTPYSWTDLGDSSASNVHIASVSGLRSTSARCHHLTDVQSGPILPAQPAKGTVGDSAIGEGTTGTSTVVSPTTSGLSTREGAAPATTRPHRSRSAPGPSGPARARSPHRRPGCRSQP